MRLWGVTRREAWQQLCAETGAQYINHSLLSEGRVEFNFQNWTIILDTYTITLGRYYRATYTRIRAPFQTRGGFRFKVYRKGIFNDLTKHFGAQTIEIGAHTFDEFFIVKSNDKPSAIQLFSSPRLQKLCCAQPQINLKIIGDDGFWGIPFPRGVEMLYFRAAAVITDVERLKHLFELFGEVLISLVELGIAEDSKPRIHISSL